MNSATIWKSKIILNWDGILPPNCDRAAIHNANDVTYFWKHLTGYTKYSKRAGNYVLNLSAQNLGRIRKQFGDIPIKGDTSHLKEKQKFIDSASEMAMRIKTLPVETLPKYNYKVQPLAEYQHRGVVYLKNIRRAPLFVDCGGGKAYMVLMSTREHIKAGIIAPGKTLICGKLTTLEAGWMEDAAKFTDLKVVNLWLPQSKNRKQKILALLEEPADIYLINHDGLRIFKDALRAKNFQKVVVDESTILKNFHGTDPRIKGGQFGRALMEVAHAAEWRVVMSGTPAPNGPQDMWGQFFFLDPEGVLLESNFHDFQNNFMHLIDLRPKAERNKPMSHRTPKKWIPQHDCVRRVGDLINPLTYRVRLRDHLKDLPPLTTIKRLIEMDAEQKRHYKDMEERLRVVIDDNRITVPVKIAQLTKLRQVTGGFIIDNQEAAHALPSNPKLAELDSLLQDEIGDQKVIIYIQYRWEAKLLEQRYKAISVYGGNTSQQNIANIDTFINDDKAKVIILHPQSASHGLTLTCAHYMVFYSINHSAELNYQAVHRIERASQKHSMFVYYLLCRKSIDTAMYDVIQFKNKNQKSLIDQDQLLLNIWRKAV